MILAPVLASKPTGGGGGYTGPLDLTTTPAAFAYGMRALSRNTLGSRVFSLHKAAGGGSFSDFHSDAITGAPPTAAAVAFAGGNPVTGSLWADQSGNVQDVLPLSLAQQPTWTPSTGFSQPSFIFNQASNQFFATVGNANWTSSSFTIFGVASFYGTTHAYAFCGIGWATSARGGMTATFHTDIEATLDNEAGSGSTMTSSGDMTALVNTAVIYDFSLDGNDPSNDLILANGVTYNPVGPSAGGVAISLTSYPFAVGSDDGATLSNPMYGELAELLVFSGIVPEPDRTNIRTNMSTFFGIAI